jgi:hypothetical protein
MGGRRRKLGRDDLHVARWGQRTFSGKGLERGQAQLILEAEVEETWTRR